MWSPDDVILKAYLNKQWRKNADLSKILTQKGNLSVLYWVKNFKRDKMSGQLPSYDF